VGARAVVWVATAAVLGAQLVPWRMSPPVLAGGGALLAAVAAAGRRRVLALSAVALLAAAAGRARLDAVDAPRLARDDVGALALPRVTTLEGTVEDVRSTAGPRTVILLGALRIDTGGASRSVRGRVRLTARCRLPKLRAGDGVRAATTLRAPRGFANPGSFDVAGHLARRGVRVIAAVWQCSRLERVPRPTGGAAMRLARWRDRLARTIDRAVPAPRGAILRALVLGDESAIDESRRRAFTRTGVVHVLSVSGLHVGLVALVGFAVVRWLLARSERLLLCLDVRRVAAVASLGPVALYGALAGFEVATLRSVIMTGVGVLAVLLGRRIEVLRTLALAAAAVALAQPGAPLEIGFQLSFASVLALALGVRRWVPAPASWGARLRATVVVSVSALAGTAPLTALHFQQVSPMSLLANPLVVPLLGSLVVVLGLAGACVEPVSSGAARLLFACAGHALRPGLALVELLARVPWAAVDVPAPSPVELVLLYAMLAVSVLPRGRARRMAAAVAVLGMAVDAGWWARERWAPGVLRVTFLDVGQGDAAVAELPDGRVVVVDAGGFPGSDFDTGAAIVAPYLATRKIARIDALVMSHAHPDHFGGLAALLRRYRPREFWWSGWSGRGAEWDRLLAALAETGVPAVVLHRGDPLPAYGDTVAPLHPPDDWTIAALNETSLTMRLRQGAVGVLLTGDIEARAEASVLGAGEDLEAAVLKVPHHGSRTSSSTGFLDAVAPRVAVISVGADNRYRLPAPEVEERYRARGVCVLRTDRCGAVTVVTDGRRLDVTAFRPGCACPADPLRRR
jgi:competence protein ComEC